MDLKSWTPLSLINQYTLNRVRLAYVFGSLGHDALMITESDVVLACGSNKSGSLGIGHEIQSLKPTSVAELHMKQVKGFSFGFNHCGTFVVAYTYSGEVYAWGYQIGEHNFFGPPLTILKPALVSFPLDTIKISEVACGSNHCLALSMDGKVCSWGFNEKGQLGNGSVVGSIKPVIIESHLKNQRVLKISCGDRFSVVLLDNGEVYAWGDNEYGQVKLKTNDPTFCTSPVKIGLLNEVIKDFVCGKAHILVLTNVGVVYGWGKNDRGELGLGDNQLHPVPEMIPTAEKFVDIAAVCPCSISAGINDKFEVFMWGDFSDYYISTPVKTSYKSLQEVFAHFASPRIMYKPMVCQLQSKSHVVNSTKRFQDKATSDLTIIAEDTEIFVHREILCAHSDYFRVFLQDHWVQEKKVLEVGWNYEVIQTYLQYIYTGEMKGDLPFALDLLLLAHEYQDLIFQNLCEERLDFRIRVDNVAHLFALALKLEATTLLEKCIMFAGYHISEVLSTPDVSNWDMDTYKEFMMQCQKRKLFRS